MIISFFWLFRPYPHLLLGMMVLPVKMTDAIGMACGKLHHDSSLIDSTIFSKEVSAASIDPG